jgi:hypothetical protein
MWWWDSDSVLTVVIVIVLEEFSYLAVTLKKIYAFGGCFVSFFIVLGDFVQQVDPKHKLQVIIQLRKTKVRPVHDLSFQCALLRNFQYFGDNVEFVSSL